MYRTSVQSLFRRLPRRKGIQYSCTSPWSGTASCRPNNFSSLATRYPGSTVLLRNLSTASSPEVENDGKHVGSSEKYDFQAETKMLLDIVAKSLYSEKEVFLRELISNSCDAMQKARLSLMQDGKPVPDMSISITTHKSDRIVEIQDSGIGLTKEEIITNLGTIAKSGTRSFMEQLKKSGSPDVSSMIGQFGVGFYSVFMVADKVEVLTKSINSPTAYKWTSIGAGTYEIEETNVDFESGTKVILHLKPECREYSDSDRLKEIIEKYSNFVSYPILLDGSKANRQQPIWTMKPKDVDSNSHNEFYRYISKAYNTPRFVLHFHTDVPISVQAVLYFPEGKPGLFDLSTEVEPGLSLYARRVLIKNKAPELIPRWLRFIKGVVDSEDIPLNLSREILQNTLLLRQLKDVVTSKIIRFLQEKASKEKVKFEEFYKEYGIFLKEGVLSSENEMQKEEIAKVLYYESSSEPKGTNVTLEDYCKRMKEEQKKIYYLVAPSRELAEHSPYLEAMKKMNLEVLFCYESYDEVVLMNLRRFKGHQLTSIENEIRTSNDSKDASAFGLDGLSEVDADVLVSWLKNTLKGKAHSVVLTTKLESHPCVVTVEEMASARHFLKTQGAGMGQDMLFSLLQPRLEINPKHPLIKKLATLKDSDPQLGVLLSKQLLNNALVAAGLIDDPRKSIGELNDLLEQLVSKIK